MLHDPEAAGRGQEGICPRVPAEGAPKGGAVIFLRHEIFNKFVSSVEAGKGMEGQIMCVEQCTF